MASPKGHRGVTEASFDDIFAVMSAASHGDGSARAHAPDHAAPEDLAARFGAALNVLLDDLAFREKAAEDMAERLRMLADASREFSAASPDYQQLLEVVARRLSELGGDLCSIRMLSDDGLSFDSGGAVHHPTPAVAAGARALLSTPQRVGEGMTGRVAASGLSLLIPKVTSADFAASTLPAYRHILEQVAVTSVIAVPLKSRGKVIGVANLLRGDPERPFTEDDLRLLESVAEHASLAIGNSRSRAAERVAQASYRLMFDASPQPMFVFDPQTLGLLEANEAAVLQYGYAREEFLSLTLEQLWPSEDVGRNRRAVAQNLPATGILAVRHRKKDGSICDVELRSNAIRFDGVECRLVLINDVTERLRAEHARRAAEARFARLADCGIIGICVGTLEGQIIEVNAAFADLLGYSRADILGGKVRWGDLTSSEWRLDDEQAREDLRATGVASLREKEYTRQDGTRVPVLVGSATVPGTASEEVIAFALDLRGSPRLEAAIEHLREARASEATFRGFLEAAPDAVVTVDQQGRIVLVNSQSERLFGYSRDELLGQAIELLIPEGLREKHAARREHYFTEPRAREMGSGLPLHGRRKNGTEFPVEISLGPIETTAGRVFAAAIRDITERQRADEQRFRLAALVAGSDDAIIGKTLAGVITSWNAGAERLFGYSEPEIIGESILRLVPPERADEEHEILRRLASGSVERFDTVRLHKDGHPVHLSVTSSPIRDSSGSLIGVAKVARDISERRRAEQALANAKDTAESASRELEAFSYSVAHDLRAPLRGVSGFSQVLLDQYQDKLDAAGHDALREIMLNARKMGELIDALLSLARLTRSQLRRELVDLSAVAREVGARLAAAEPGRAVALSVEPGLGADVDPVLTRALFDNLFGNAWKFSGKTPAPCVVFGATQRDGVRTFYVRDNGAGFDMAFANKLFGPFQRLHAEEEFPGTGIGLATVQRIVHRHGGKVWAEGKVDEGATFYFTLPSRLLAGEP